MGHDGGPQGATSDETDWDAAALQEWVAHVADTEAISEGEVLDRMLSSLWILDEVESLMEDTDDTPLPDRTLGSSPTPDASDQPDVGDDGDPAATPTDSRDSTGVSSAAESSRSGIDQNLLLGVVEALRGKERPASSTIETGRTARLDSRLDAVVEDLATIRSRVDRLDEEIDVGSDDGSTDTDVHETVDLLEGRLTRIEDAIESNRESIDSQAGTLDSYDESITGVEETLTAHDDAIDSHAETLSAFGDTLCKHADRLSAVETTSDTMAAEQDGLRESVGENFENVDVALRFLVDRTDDVTSTVEELEASIAAERRERRRRADERRRLADLRHDLANHGVTRATCESCRNRVDVSCLLEPRCPHCDRVFDGHRRSGGVFGFLATDELTTTQTGPRMESRRREQPTADSTPGATPSPVDD